MQLKIHYNKYINNKFFILISKIYKIMNHRTKKKINKLMKKNKKMIIIILIKLKINKTK